MHQKVRLGSNDQRESLQRSCDIDFGIDQPAAAPFDFAKVVDVAVRRNGPQHICRIDAAQFVRARQVIQVQLDPCAAPALPADSRGALQARQARRSMKGDLDRLVQRIRDRDG